MHKISRNDILELMKKPYKKISHDNHQDEDFKLQPFITNLNIEEARIKFKLKTKMTPAIRMNFSSDPEFASNL